MSLLAVAGANSAVAAGYDIANSVKLQEAGVNTEFFNYTVSTTGNRKTGTISMWIKRTEIGVLHYIFEMGGTDNDTDRLHCRFNSTDTLNLATGSVNWRITNRVFRDTSAWYHLVVAVDTTQATASDRVKIYINGVEETSFSTSNNPSQNANTGLAYQKQVIGFSEIDNTGGLDGYLADVCVVDGQQLAASDFGEFDTDTGIWKPKNLSSISVGTNGSLMKFENAASMGANSASAGHGFSVQNINQNDQATDTPTNNFATLNPLVTYYGSATINEGATKIQGTSTSSFETVYSTIAVTSGKWYFELVNLLGSTRNTNFGIVNLDTAAFDGTAYNSAGFWLGNTDAGAQFYYYENGVATGNEYVTFSQGDIIGLAFDADNGTLDFYLNNSNQEQFTGIPSGTFAFIVEVQGTGAPYIQANFGGYTTISIASAASDANGYGNFEYAPPSGYYAICSKNLAEFG